MWESLQDAWRINVNFNEESFISENCFQLAANDIKPNISQKF